MPTKSTTTSAPRVARELAHGIRGLLRRRRAVRPHIKRRLPRFLPGIDREDFRFLNFRNLDRRKPDASRADYDYKIVFARLTLGHDGAVGGRTAATERRGDGRVEIRREREDGVLLRDDELRVATRDIEAN